MDLFQHSSSTNLTTTLPKMNFDNVLARMEYIILPIKEIDGVRVCVTICPASTKHMCRPAVIDCLRFCISVVYADENGEDELDHRVDNQDEFDKMIILITNLKFCKTTNKLVDGRKITPLTAEYFKCLVSPTITMYDECCVCLEMTRGETACKHPICLHCVSHLARPVCPLCRGIVSGRDEEDE